MTIFLKLLLFNVLKLLTSSSLCYISVLWFENFLSCGQAGQRKTFIQFLLDNVFLTIFCSFNTVLFL